MSEHLEERAMSEQTPPSDAGAAQAPGQQDPEMEPTGHPDVDAVVASLAGLDGRPVSEHVAVFEAAHDRLRGALADAGNHASGS